MSPSDGDPQLLYLEPDDEITSVIRRLRGADVGRVVLVAPGRSRATSSVVALRLLARAAADTGRSVALVADASTRALAGEAGVAAFASVADATSPTPSPAEPMTPTRAPIHVVRGAAPARGQPAKAPPPTDGLDETVAVHLPPPVAARGGSRGSRRGFRIPRWPWLAGLLAVAVVAGAVLLPSATVHLRPVTTSVTPQAFPVEIPVTGHLTDDLTAAKTGTATGERPELVPARGVVTFFNWNSFDVDVPQGTHVSVGGTTAFATIERIRVPKRRSFQNPEPGQKSVGVVAVEPGTDGNVAAQAIDTIDDVTVRVLLRAFDDNSNRLVSNADPTTGGLETTHQVIEQTDIDAAVDEIKADLQQQLDDLLARDPDRIYADAPESETPSVEVPPELVGKEDTSSFELTGTLHIDRAFGSRADVEATANGAIPAPPGKALVPDSVVVDVRSAADQGDTIVVQVSVSAEAAAVVDEAAVRDLVAGKTVEEARTALEDVGEIAVDLWPPWLDRLPALSFRIDIILEVKTDSSGASPGESVN